MSDDGEAARSVRASVRWFRTKRLLLVIGAVGTVAALLLAAGWAGLLTLRLHGVPVSEDFAWITEMTGADPLRAAGYDGTGVTVCLVDTGVDMLHPDLATVELAGWNDLVHREASPYDDGGHGTAMAGLLAGRGRVEGIAPGVSLLVVKALDADGTGSSTTVGAAIDFCVDPNRDGDLRDGADVISLSLGAQTTPFTTNAAIQAARDATERGVFVVAAAGNDGREDDGDVNSPAGEPLVVAVGSVNHRLEVAAFSSRGTNEPGDPERVDPHRKPEFVLPGVGLITTASGSSYTAMTGTSTSAALMAGLLALLLDALPAYRKGGAAAVVTIKDALRATADPLEGQALPHDDYAGYGVPRADDTLTRLRTG